ncbi:MAG: guanylate kinase [Anaerolineae bacterium]|nr:guanylate kinase [Anaerolineae bacterium]
MEATTTQRGVFFVLVGPAGSGKNYVMQAVLPHLPGLRQLPTATTRPMRDGEAQGREHEFVSHEEFASMIHNNELIEYQPVHGNLYGIPRRSVERVFDQRLLEVADVEYKGADIAHALYGSQVVRVFVSPPSVSKLIERLLQRRTSYPEIARRMLRTPEELLYANQCEYVIPNGDDNNSPELFQVIVAAEREDRRADVARASVPRAALGALLDVRCGRYTLRPVAHPAVLPAVPFAPPEWPHRAAERAVTPLLEDGLPEGRWTYTRYESNEFIAPDRLGVTRDGDLEQVLYRYTYNVPHTRVTPPGWEWAYALRPSDGYDVD